MLEFCFGFLIFCAAITFSINFFIHAYAGTLLSLAAQEAGREVVSSLSTADAQEKGLTYIQNYGIGKLIENPTVTVKIDNTGTKNSIIEASVSADVSYHPFGAQFFASNGVVTKTARYFLEHNLRPRVTKNNCVIQSWGDQYDC